MKYFAILFASLLILTSCGEKKENTDTQQGEQTEMPDGHPDMNGMDGGMGSGSTALTYDNGRVFMADFSLKIPETWNMMPPSSNMRLVEFLPNGNKEIPIIGFYFGNQDNMVEANIKRWENEFVKLEDSNTEEFVDGKIKFVKLTGTFKLKPFPMAQEFEETPGFMTLACIIPSSEGPYFFKVFGPQDELEKEIPNFKKFLESYRIEADI